jgi:hypothetical protein
MDIKISKELLKNCDTIITKNKVKQCEKTKPICLVLEGLLAKAIKKNGQCKEKKQKAKVSKQPSVKQPSVKQPSVKQPSVKQPSVKKEIEEILALQPEVKNQVSEALPLYIPPVVVKTATVKQQSIKKQPSQAPPSYEQVTKYDEELIKNYIKATFKKVSIEFKSCDDIQKYKEDLRKKCIKFLGYDSPAKTPECVKFRFRKFLKENSKLQNSLTKFGCSIDI